MKIAKILSIIGFALFFGMIFSAIIDCNPLYTAIPLATYGIISHFNLLPLPGGILMTNFGAITSIEVPEIDGRESMGGYTMVAYLALLSDIETYPTEPNIETETHTKNLAKLTGSVAMKTEKYFYKVLVKPQTSQFQPAGQGEVAGKSFQPKGKFFIPGLDDYTMGVARLLNNKFGVIILPDADGKHRIWVGTEDLPCEFKPSGDSGAKAADVKGFTFEFVTDSFAPGWIYEGTIPLDGATLPGVS